MTELTTEDMQMIIGTHQSRTLIHYDDAAKPMLRGWLHAAAAFTAIVVTMALLQRTGASQAPTMTGEMFLPEARGATGACGTGITWIIEGCAARTRGRARWRCRSRHRAPRNRDRAPTWFRGTSRNRAAAATRAIRTRRSDGAVRW